MDFFYEIPVSIFENLNLDVQYKKYICSRDSDVVIISFEEAESYLNDDMDALLRFFEIPYNYYLRGNSEEKSFTRFHLNEKNKVIESWPENISNDESKFKNTLIPSVDRLLFLLSYDHEGIYNEIMDRLLENKPNLDYKDKFLNISTLENFIETDVSSYLVKLKKHYY